MRARHSRAGIGGTLTAALAAAVLAAATGAAAAPAQHRPWTRHCTILGTEGADVLRGTAGADVICGLGGDDVIYGLGGNDILFGGAGDDHLHGGPGDDVLRGQGGDDELDGGPGRDDELGTGIEEVVGGPVTIQPTYNLPTGTKVEWIYVPSSGNCIAEQENPVVTIGDTATPAAIHLFSQPTYWTFDICYFESKYGTWQVRITTPSGIVKTGSIAFISKKRYKWEASTHDFSGIVNGGGYINDYTYDPVPMTIGPIQ